MVTAVVLHPPRFGATVASVDDHAALDEPGVIAVVPIDEGVAVVGETVADAQRGLRALNVSWDDTGAERRSSSELLAEHLPLLESGEKAVVSRDDGDVDQALASAEATIDAIYTLPYLAHAAMEPNNAACRMREDGMLEVWASTESPEYTQMAASEAGGIDKDQVEVHVTFAGRLVRPSQHLQPRSDHRGRARRTGARLEAPGQGPVAARGGLQDRPLPRDGRAPRPRRRRRCRSPDGGPPRDGRRTDLGSNLPYVRDVLFTDGVDFMTVDRRRRRPVRIPELPARVDQLRVGRADHGLALGRQLPHRVRARVGDRRARDRRRPRPRRPPTRAARREPADAARARARRRDARAGDRRCRKGSARGITCSSFLSHSAQVTEISLDDRGRVHVDRIVYVLDCGIEVNPDLIRAQVEGGLLFGLSAAAWGEVVLGDGGEIVTQNFDRYPVVRMRSVPTIEVHLIESTEPPTGVGEVSVPSAAPALTNAIAALTGTRIRQLPINKTIKIA